MRGTTLPLAAALILMAALLPPPRPARAEEPARPKMEVGLLGGYVSWPHYPGARDRYSLPLGVPYFIYRGQRLRVDRSGVRGLLASGNRFALDLGFSFHPPVLSSDDAARSGMDDLPLAGEVGPRLIGLLHRFDDQWSLLFRLPVRAVGDIEGRSHGYTAEPDLLLTADAPPGGWGGYVATGLLYGSRAFNDHYYGVPDKDATPGRPAWNADQGIVATVVTLGLSYHGTGSIRGGAYAQGNFLGGGAVAESPLVGQPEGWSIGLWIAWTFWQSAEREQERKGIINTLPEDGAVR